MVSLLLAAPHSDVCQYPLELEQVSQVAGPRSQMVRYHGAKPSKLDGPYLTTSLQTPPPDPCGNKVFHLAQTQVPEA